VTVGVRVAIGLAGTVGETVAVAVLSFACIVADGWGVSDGSWLTSWVSLSAGIIFSRNASGMPQKAADNETDGTARASAATKE